MCYHDNVYHLLYRKLFTSWCTNNCDKMQKNKDIAATHVHLADGKGRKNHNLW